MRYKIYFLIVTAFFVTMNVLLWRSEFSARGRLGAPLPADSVWEKVLTSPDNSFLEVRHKGIKIGRAHWAATISEIPAAALLNTDEIPPEGMVNTVSSYTLDCDGTISLEDLSRVKFTCSIRFDTNQAWQEISLKIVLKPYSWEIRSSAQSQAVRFITDDDSGHHEKSYPFSDLRDPEKLIKSFGGPLMPSLLALSGFPSAQSASAKNAGSPKLSIGLAWAAHNDWLKIGRTPIRVYRVEARLFDRYRAAFFVSPVGEILRVELPDDIVLMNEAILSLNPDHPG